MYPEDLQGVFELIEPTSIGTKSRQMAASLTDEYGKGKPFLYFEDFLGVQRSYLGVPGRTAKRQQLDQRRRLADRLAHSVDRLGLKAYFFDVLVESLQLGVQVSYFVGEALDRLVQVEVFDGALD